MGTAMENLDRLLAMPYGCGEQNMVLFVPNIFILEYLQSTHLTPEIKNKAIRFLESGETYWGQIIPLFFYLIYSYFYENLLFLIVKRQVLFNIKTPGEQHTLQEF
ncbi:unnamed protein product [Staurois parvus]|uniref:Alpha-macroglobulin-like TED domain-containing protein n=1 Tax=Staurois parvus TaxID=386267 RepID=A0ABN9EU41_9NEOB|nr:unnamed protein product [Staurois parvus]